MAVIQIICRIAVFPIAILVAVSTLAMFWLVLFPLLTVLDFAIDGEVNPREHIGAFWEFATYMLREILKPLTPPPS